MRTMRIAIAAVLVLRCGEPTGPKQTTHTWPVTKDETWTLAGSPHIVQGQLFVSHGATLTIEAGARVLFDTGAQLIFGRTGTGTLHALGTAGNPITLRSLDTAAAPGSWVRIALRSNTASEMRY